MSNELQKILDGVPAKSWKEKIQLIEDSIVAFADGENIVGDGNSIVYPDFWEYKHSFADGIYVREMRMKKDQIGFSAIHKRSYTFFLLSGVLFSSQENGMNEFIAPCYVVSPAGVKRVVYAAEDCVITTVHANPTNTKDLDEIVKNTVVFSWQEYDEYKNKEYEKNK